jgi:uncharacterized protein
VISIQKLLGKEQKFFGLLEASAEEALRSVQVLVKYLKQPEQLNTLDEFVAVRRKDKAINLQITEALCTHFITAIEREDIEALSSALYKIPKTAEKIAERLTFRPRTLTGVDLSKQGPYLEQAARSVHKMTRQLSKGMGLAEMQAFNAAIQAAEGDADKILVQLLRELYSSSYDGLEGLFLKDIYELNERVVDRCRDAGNVITQIVLKNA